MLNDVDIFEHTDGQSFYPWLGEGQYMDIVLNPNGEWISEFDLSVTSSYGVWFPSSLNLFSGPYRGEVTPVFNIRMLADGTMVDLSGFDFAHANNRLYDIGFSLNNGGSLQPIVYQDSGYQQLSDFFGFENNPLSSWGVLRNDEGADDRFGGLIFGHFSNGAIEIGLISGAGAESDAIWNSGPLGAGSNLGTPDAFFWDSSASAFYALSSPVPTQDKIEITVLSASLSVDPSDGKLNVETLEKTVSFSGLDDARLQAPSYADSTITLGPGFYEGGAFVQTLNINDSEFGYRSEFLVYDLDQLGSLDTNSIQQASNLVSQLSFVQPDYAPLWADDYWITDTYVYAYEQLGPGDHTVQLIDLKGSNGSAPIEFDSSDIESAFSLGTGEVQWFEVVDRVGDEIYFNYSTQKYIPSSTFSEAPVPDPEYDIKGAVYDLDTKSWTALDGSHGWEFYGDFGTKDFYFWNDIEQTPLDIQWQLVDARGNIIESIAQGTSEQVSLRLYSLRDGVAESSSGHDFPSNYYGSPGTSDYFSFNLSTAAGMSTYNVEMGEGISFRTYTDVNELLQNGFEDPYLESPAGASYETLWRADLDGDGYSETRVGYDIPGDAYEFWLDFSDIDSEVRIFAELGQATIRGQDNPLLFVPADNDVLYDYPEGLEALGFDVSTLSNMYEGGVSYGFNAYKLGSNAEFEGINDASEIVSIASGSGHVVNLGGSVFGSDFDVISFREYEGPIGFEIDLNSAATQVTSLAGLTEFYVTGADAVVGSSQGDDIILGYTNRVNVLSGEGGQDTIVGGDLSDVILTGFDNDADSASGGLGDDVLLGSADDTLEGGEGKDLLVFASDQHGFTGTISDFELSSDRLSLSPRAGSAADRFGIGLDLSMLSAAFSQVGMMSSQIEALIDSARWSDDVDNSSANIALRRHFDLDISEGVDGHLDVSLFLKSDYYLRNGGDYELGENGGRLVKLGDALEGEEVGPLAKVSMKVGEYSESEFDASTNTDPFEVILLPESYEIFAKMSPQIDGADGSGRANAFGYVSGVEPYNAMDFTGSYIPTAYSGDPATGLGTGDLMIFHFAVSRSVEGVVSASQGIPTNFARRDSNGDDLNTIFRVSNDTQEHVFLGGRAEDKYEFVGREFIEDTGEVSENQAFSDNLVIERGVLPGLVDEDRDSIVLDGLSAFDPSLDMQRVMLGREGLKSLDISWEESRDDSGQIVMNQGDLQIFKQFDGVNTAFRVEDVEFVYQGESKVYDLGTVRVATPQGGAIKSAIETEIVTSGGRDAMLVGRDSGQDLFVIEAGSASPLNSSFEVHLWGVSSKVGDMHTRYEDVLEVRGYGDLLDVQRIQTINPPGEESVSPEDVSARGSTLHYSGATADAGDDVLIDLYIREGYFDFMPTQSESVMVRTDADADGSVEDLAAVIWTDDGVADFVELDFSAETLMDATQDNDQVIEVHVLDASPDPDALELGAPTDLKDFVGVVGVGEMQLSPDDSDTPEYDPILSGSGSPQESPTIDVDVVPLESEIVFEGLDETTGDDNVTVAFVFEATSPANDIDVFAYAEM